MATAHRSRSKISANERRKRRRDHRAGALPVRCLRLEPLEDRRLLSLTVMMDKDDYAPGETAIITANALLPGETVEFDVLHTDGTPNTGLGHEPWRVVDGGVADLDGFMDGNVQTAWLVDEDDSLGSTFELTAKGLASGEVTTTQFTDGWGDGDSYSRLGIFQPSVAANSGAAVFVNEGNTTATAWFPVSWWATDDKDDLDPYVTVYTVDGTATTGDNDYTAKSVTLHFTSEGTKWVGVTVKGDTKAELNESFLVRLGNASSGTSIYFGSQSCDLVNDDNFSLTTNEDTAKLIALPYVDDSRFPVRYRVVSSPTRGSLVGGSNRTKTYTPNADYHGADSFRFVVEVDLDGTWCPLRGEYTVDITVNPVNDAPSANGQSVSTNEDVSKSITLAGSDPDGEAVGFWI